MTNDHRPISSTRVPKAIWEIGCAVFFVNLSSVMIRSLSPVYMKTILGVSIGWIGFVEGLMEGLSFLTKMMSGVFSDYFRRRKLIIVLGYSFMMLSRPIIALFASIHAVIIARALDRLGNGIQASPRDALVGDFAPKDIRGACYGLRISLGIAGSFTGALCGLTLMYLNNDDYQLVFLLASIPAIIAIIIMAFFVKEPEINLHPKDNKPRHPIHFSDIPRLGKRFWLLMTVVSIFMIAQLGEAIMTLHAHKNFELCAKNTPLILLVYNSTYSLASYPAGILSDRFGRYSVLATGFCFLIAGDMMLAKATSLAMLFSGVALCGTQMAITQSIFMSLVTDSVPEDLRGTGFGIFYVVCALSVLISNSSAGYIAELYGESMSFVVSMCVAFIALCLLLIIKPQRSKVA
jgi:MFS family permease